MANDYQPPRNGGAAYKKTFTSVAAQVDLRAQSGYPNHAPGLLDVASAAAGGDLVYTDLKGNSNTIQIPAATITQIEGPIATLEAGSADELDITAHWWIDSTTRFNP